jgi:hypothetical protein
MTPVLKTRIHNLLNVDKTFHWVEGGICIAAGGDVTVDYDVYTRSLDQGKVGLLKAAITSKSIELSYLINEQIKVETMADETDKPVEKAPAKPNLAVKAEERAVKETNEKLPEMLQTKEQLEEKRQKTRFDLNDVIWKKDKAEPKPMPEPMNVTVERLKTDAERHPMSPGKPSRQANVIKV